MKERTIMLTTARNVSRKLAAAFLTLLLIIQVLPIGAQAAETNLPDWYFLFAIFKNVDADFTDNKGKTTHVQYTMTQNEVKMIRDHAQQFEEFMSQTGEMNAHVDVIEIDTAVKELKERSGEYSEPYIGAEQAAPILKSNKVDLDHYDHVFCATSLNFDTNYYGLTGSAFENGTGHSCVNFENWEHCQNFLIPVDSAFPPTLYVHEFLHFVERQSRKWGMEFNIHLIGDKIYAPTKDSWKTCYTDIILNRVKGDAETGTGVSPLVWQYPPHVFRTMSELTIPSGVTSIGERAFQDCSNLSKVNIQSGVSSIGNAAFERCTALTEITIPSSVTSIGEWAFQGCTALTEITIPASVTSIGDVAFYKTGLTDVYYGGTEAQWKAIAIGDYNNPLTKANIHYNSNVFENEPHGTLTISVNDVNVPADDGIFVVPHVTIILHVKPDPGYKLSDIRVVTADKKEITLSRNGNDYTFIMPEADVSVAAKFTKA